MRLVSQLLNMRPDKQDEMSGDLLSETDGADNVGIRSSVMSPEPTTEDIVKMVTKWKKWVVHSYVHAIYM